MKYSVGFVFTDHNNNIYKIVESYKDYYMCQCIRGMGCDMIMQVRPLPDQYIDSCITEQ